MTLQAPQCTEDKLAWCDHGLRLEHEFVAIAYRRWCIFAMINPEKKTNPYALDIIANGRLVDLKSIRTPFFLASRYGYDPNFTATLGVRVVQSHAGEDMFFLLWVCWPDSEGYGVKVKEHNALYVLPGMGIERIVGPIHAYQGRVDDSNGNSKESHLIDVRRLWKIGEVLR